MIGVIVWSNADREKAVIWCEDQGALAYLQGRENLAVAAMPWPEAGDLMELETEDIASLRHARRVSLLAEGGCPALPDMLRQNAAPAEPRLRLVSSQEALPRTPDRVAVPVAPLRAARTRVLA